jgi:hypothetical protein
MVYGRFCDDKIQKLKMPSKNAMKIYSKGHSSPGELPSGKRCEIGSVNAQ